MSRSSNVSMGTCSVSQNAAFPLWRSLKMPYLSLYQGPTRLKRHVMSSQIRWSVSTGSNRRPTCSRLLARCLHRPCSWTTICRMTSARVDQEATRRFQLHYRHLRSRRVLYPRCRRVSSTEETLPMILDMVLRAPFDCRYPSLSSLAPIYFLPYGIALQ